MTDLDTILARFDALEARLDAAERPLLSVREAGALLGLGREATLRFCRSHGVLINVGGERGLRVLRADLMDALRAATVGSRHRRSRSQGSKVGRGTSPANQGDHADGLADPDGQVTWDPAFG